MLYQVEEIKVKKRKLVIVYILILLLVLVVSIGFGIYAAKIVNGNQVKASNEESKNEIINEFILGKNIQKEEEKSDKQEISDNFYDIVEDIYNGEEGKRVFLTFDDGPAANVTPHILDILKKHEIKATFFVIGNRISSNKELIKREYEEGHYIANHGYSHKYSKIYSSSSKVIEEYNKTEEEIRKALNISDYSSHVFRFPGGSIGGQYNSLKKEAKKQLKKNNIAYLDWNALTSDADGANTKEKIMKSLKSTVKNKNNVVVLMHDAPDKKITYETLEDVIIYLKDKGYEFKTMYDLIKMEE